MRGILTTLAVSASLAAGSASAATITFSDLSGSNGSSFTSPYSEAGFTVSYVSGNLRTAKAFGNPTPALFFNDTATFDISGGLFSLSSFDGAIASRFGNVTYAITGYLNNILTFSQSITTNSQTFSTLATSSGQQTFDRVRFAMSTTSSSANIDNINVSAVSAAVPEPATWALMILGFGAIGGAMRRLRMVVSNVRYA